MENMQAAFQLCGCRGWLSPADTCSIQATCKELLHTGVTWDMYKQEIALDLSSPTGCTWLSKNIPTIKQLQITVPAADAIRILASAALLTSLHIDSTAAGALGLKDTSFLQGLRQLGTLRIEAPLLTGLCCLPSSLLQLDITSCPVETLPSQLPRGLTALNCNDCRELRKLSTLPEGLQEFKVGRCESLPELPQLPQGLTYLDMRRLHSLVVAPNLPTRLQYLDMECCGALPELPSSLTYLDVSEYFGQQDLPSALPPKLKTLKIEDWDNLECLPVLPPSLQRLSCRRCNLNSLEGLPNGLTYLDIEYNEHLLQLPEDLPSNLEVLRITGCEQLVILPKLLPSNLKVLQADSVPMQHLPDLPSTLEVLDILSCQQLLTLPNLATATSLQELEISESPALDEMPRGPPGLGNLQHLTGLTLNGLDHLTQVDVLPPGLKQFGVSECPKLAFLPCLPIGLTELLISKCPELKSSVFGILQEDNMTLPSTLKVYIINWMPTLLLPMLPAGLMELDVSNNESMLALPEVLPTGLTQLSCCGITNISLLPPLPAGLAALSCEGCSNLRSLPELPAKLTELLCSNCLQLKVLPELPAKLRHLDCRGCKVLTTLPAVPPGLTYLNCSDCTSLQQRLDISSTCMRNLKCSGCPKLLIPLEQLKIVANRW